MTNTFEVIGILTLRIIILPNFVPDALGYNGMQ